MIIHRFISLLMMFSLISACSNGSDSANSNEEIKQDQNQDQVQVKEIAVEECIESNLGSKSGEVVSVFKIHEIYFSCQKKPNVDQFSKIYSEILEINEEGNIVIK